MPPQDESHERHLPSIIWRQMAVPLAVSVFIGACWGHAVSELMGYRFFVNGRPYLGHYFAGICVVVAAGIHTIWSRSRRDGRESLLPMLICHFGGIGLYWAALCVWGFLGGYDHPPTDLKADYQGMLMAMVFYGTIFSVPIGVLWFISRRIIWESYPPNTGGTIAKFFRHLRNGNSS